MRKAIVSILLAVVLIPSVVFLQIMPVPTFDETYHLTDIYRYINLGINRETIYAQTTPTGPATHRWAALWGKLFGSKLSTLRLSIWICWIAICLIFYKLFKQEHKDKLLFSFLFLFTNPYASCLSGLVMTEAFGLMAILAGVYYLQKSSYNPTDYFSLILCGLCMGIAIVSRLYYICIIPCLAVCMLYMYRNNSYSRDLFIKLSLLLLFAIAPLFILYTIWGSITPPLFNKGEVFRNSKIYLGVNLLRPLSALLYVGIYCFPFFLIFNPKLLIKKWPFWPIAFLVSFFVTYNVYLWRLERVHTGTGLIDALVTFAYKINGTVGTLAYFISVCVAAMGVLLLIHKSLISLKTHVSVIALFSYTLVLFFIIQQSFVSGQTPFYDRYLIQIAPFLGLITFDAKIKFDYRLLSLVIIYLIIGQFILWRFYGQAQALSAL
jgi:hypothetical protein